MVFCRNLVFLFVSTTLVSVGLLAAEPLPVFPFLADSAWPMTHRHPYNQASSPLSANLKGKSLIDGGLIQKMDKRIDKSVCRFSVPVTYVLGPLNESGKYSIWGNCKGKVFKASADGQSFQVTQVVTKGSKSPRALSGAYSLIDSDNVYFFPHYRTILGYTEEKLGVAESSIVTARQLSVPDSLFLSSSEELSFNTYEQVLQTESEFKLEPTDDTPDIERQNAVEDIVGLSMTVDGFLVAVSRYNMVMILDRKEGLKVSLRLTEPAALEEVSNSVAVDELGGIYTLTDKAVYKSKWNGKTLESVWRQEYPTSDRLVPGRLGKGSGTTPTLMGSEQNRDRLLVIADGMESMNLLAIWRDDSIPDHALKSASAGRRIADSVKIDFGNPNLKRAITEQSVLVSGTGAVVVNNDYGETPAATPMDAKKIVLYSNKDQFAPFGIQKFNWSSDHLKWINSWPSAVSPDASFLSAPNGIPCMSEADNAMYYVGRDSDENWTFEAVDWETGKLKSRKKLSKSIYFNSFYAAAQIGPYGEIFTGSYEGGYLWK